MISLSVLSLERCGGHLKLERQLPSTERCCATVFQACVRKVKIEMAQKNIIKTNLLSMCFWLRNNNEESPAVWWEKLAVHLRDTLKLQF